MTEIVNPLAGIEYEMAWGPWGTGTHHHGQNWQSGCAWDLLHGSDPMPVLAPIAGKVVSAGDGGAGRFAGVKLGIQGDGLSCFLTHMSERVVGYGDQVLAGEVVGYTGQAVGVYHLHVALGGPDYADMRDENGIDPGPPLMASAELVAPKGPKGYPLYRGAAPVLEEPPPDGGSLRLVLEDKRWAGWEEAGGALKWIAKKSLAPNRKVALAWRGTLRRYDPARDPAHVLVTNRGGQTRKVEGNALYVAQVCRSLARRYL